MSGAKSPRKGSKSKSQGDNGASTTREESLSEFNLSPSDLSSSREEEPTPLVMSFKAEEEEQAIKLPPDLKGFLKEMEIKFQVIKANPAYPGLMNDFTQSMILLDKVTTEYGKDIKKYEKKRAEPFGRNDLYHKEKKTSAYVRKQSVIEGEAKSVHAKKALQGFTPEGKREKSNGTLGEFITDVIAAKQALENYCDDYGNKITIMKDGAGKSAHTEHLKNIRDMITNIKKKVNTLQAPALKNKPK